MMRTIITRLFQLLANESGRILAVWRDRIVEYDEEGNPKVDDHGYVLPITQVLLPSLHDFWI